MHSLQLLPAAGSHASAVVVDYLNPLIAPDFVLACCARSVLPTVQEPCQEPGVCFFSTKMQSTPTVAGCLVCQVYGFFRAADAFPFLCHCSK